MRRFLFSLIVAVTAFFPLSPSFSSSAGAGDALSVPRHDVVETVAHLLVLERRMMNTLRLNPETTQPGNLKHNDIMAALALVTRNVRSAFEKPGLFPLAFSGRTLSATENTGYQLDIVDGRHVDLRTIAHTLPDYMGEENMHLLTGDCLFFRLHSRVMSRSGRVEQATNALLLCLSAEQTPQGETPYTLQAVRAPPPLALTAAPAPAPAKSRVEAWLPQMAYKGRRGPQ